MLLGIVARGLHRLVCDVFAAPGALPADAFDGAIGLQLGGGDRFAERRDGSYRNPLRAGALSPWRDDTRPLVSRVVFSRNGTAVPANAVSGAVDVIAEAHDVPPVAVPSPWNGLPVTPARIRWRVVGQSGVVRSWHTPVDFTNTLLPRSAFARIYAPGTRQNHAGEPGLYRFYLAHTWTTTTLPDGGYDLEVEASDLAGNTGSRTQRFTIAA